jgi:hypothetical protein
MEPVFELIKSMNQGEKRYFKRLSTLRSESEESNYVKLFNAIEKSKKYNEKALIAEFGKKFYAQYKRHLFTKVLEALRGMKDAHSVEMQVRSLINESEVLIERSLFKSAMVHIRNAGKKAEKYELFLEQIRSYSVELDVLSRENDLTNFRQRIAYYKELNKKISEKIDNQLQFEELYSQFVQWNHSIELIRSEEELVALSVVLSSSLLENESKAFSLKSKIHYYYIHGLGCFFKGDFATSLSYFKKQKEIIEEHPWMNINQLTVLKCLGNICLLSLKNNDTLRFERAYETFLSYKVSGSYQEYYQWYLSYFLKLMSLNSVTENDKGIEFIEKNEKKNKAVRLWIREHDTMYTEYCYSIFKIVEFYLLGKQPRQALKNINDFLNNAQVNLKQDTYCIARIINLLIHFELANVELIENEIKSVHRFLSQRDRIYGFDRSVLQFLNKAINIPAGLGYKELLGVLHSEWEELKQDKYEKHVFEYFDFTGWLSLKI